MRTWERAATPRLPGTGPHPALHDANTDAPLVVPMGGTASLYTCGITPYDATHIGHAATYLASDMLTRVWLDAGLDVRTAMNSTDVDDPLLERATRDGVDWLELAEREQEVFRADMAALRILPPDSWIAVTERIDAIADAVAALLDSGDAYRVDDDVYFDTTRVRAYPLGLGSRTDREAMLHLAGKPLHAL